MRVVIAVLVVAFVTGCGEMPAANTVEDSAVGTQAIAADDAAVVIERDAAVEASSDAGADAGNTEADAGHDVTTIPVEVRCNADSGTTPTAAMDDYCRRTAPMVPVARGWDLPPKCIPAAEVGKAIPGYYPKPATQCQGYYALGSRASGGVHPYFICWTTATDAKDCQ